MKVNVTTDAGAEMLKQEEHDNIEALGVHDDGSLFLRTNLGSEINFEPDEWVAFAAQKEETS